MTRHKTITSQVRPVTGTRIARGLRRLGIAGGETIMLHSSLRSFGWVDGGAPTVVRALLEALGEKGTLVVPTFSAYLQQGESCWDREHTPSRMGAISEAVRTWPGALRSSHAAHPLAALGPHARLLCRRPHRTGFGPDSPFGTLVELDAVILFMGTTWNTCTIFHLLEAEREVPYRFLERRPAVVIIDGRRDESGGAWEHSRRPGASNDFRPFGRRLEQEGLVRRARVGGCLMRAFNAAPMHRLGTALLAADPYFLHARRARR